MNKKKILAGLILGMGMTLAAQAETFTFTPITNTDNATLQSLGEQLQVNVTQVDENTAQFTFTNAGGVQGTINGIFFDDARGNQIGDITLTSQTTGVNFVTREDDRNLPGGDTNGVNFRATDAAVAVPPRGTTNGRNGVNNTGNESVTFQADLTPGTTFADLVAGLSGTDNNSANDLRIGLRVGSITGGPSRNVSFVNDTGDGGGSPPPPIPEPETYSMLLAGLGLMTALARRRQRRS